MTRWVVFAFLSVLMAAIGIAGTVYGMLLMFGNLDAVLNDGESWMTILTRQGAVTILGTGGIFLTGAIVTYTASEVLDYISTRRQV